MQRSMRMTPGPAERPVAHRFRLLGKRSITSAIAALTAAVVVTANPMPAQAVDPATIVGAAMKAYDVYQKLAGGGLTLEDATTRIIDAVNTAKTDIMRHTDRLATAEVRACTTSAVINVADIGALSPDSRQLFALNATDCVTLAQSLLSTVGTAAAVDELGFAVNVVGPIALLARTSAGLMTGGLRSSLIAADNTVLTRLKPSCVDIPLWGDAGPGQPVEVEIICTAYNGARGYDAVVLRIRRGQPLPPIDHTSAINDAVAATSHPVAVAALPVLTA
ncbi:hypothetical protein [Actinoplanes sp. CA-252034]|uniref:hypothetical protein n=1 Tax=Actinoplanes sp. CA-252034 TaxID=3239906 RepID=UPI003D99E29A